MRRKSSSMPFMSRVLLLRGLPDAALGICMLCSEEVGRENDAEEVALLPLEIKPDGGCVGRELRIWWSRYDLENELGSA